MTDLECEFGSSFPVRFVDASMVTAYDSHGNKIKIPQCEKCGNYKGEIIGKEYSAWICMMGCE